MTESPIAKIERHKVEIMFSKELLRCVGTDIVRQAGAERGVPEGIEPKVCGHRRSPSVKYTWEWNIMANSPETEYWKAS